MDINANSAYIFKPKIRPDNILDLGIAFACGVAQMVFAILLPSVFFFLYSQDLNLTFIIYMLMSVLWALFTVKSIRLSRHGIEIARILGTPKRIRWEKITLIRQATNEEVVFHGWLWPPFPAKDMTYSLSSTGHYRIEYDKGYIFFPPSEPEKFEQVALFFKTLSRNQN